MLLTRRRALLGDLIGWWLWSGPASWFCDGGEKVKHEPVDPSPCRQARRCATGQCVRVADDDFDHEIISLLMSLWHHWLHLKTTSPGWTANESSPPRESSIVAYHDIIAIVAHIDIIAIVTYHDMITIVAHYLVLPIKIRDPCDLTPGVNWC